jgi:outer membrane protein assembly complex protein YaeT
VERLIALVAALLLASAPAQPGAAAPAEAPPRVRALDLRLPPGEDGVAVAALVAVSPGGPISTRALRRTVQLLFQTGRFQNVLVRSVPAAAPPGTAGAWVDVIVEALPARLVQAVTIRFDGPAVVDPDRLRAAAALPVDEPFDPGALEDAAGRVRAALGRRGYPDAQVQAGARGEQGVIVELTVRAGPPARVAAVRLGGARPLAVARLADDLRTRPGAVLDEDLLAEDVRTLRTRLQQAGYLRARVGTPAIRAGGGVAEVEIPVEPGPHVTFLFRGNALVPADVLARQLQLEEGQTLDAPAIEAAADRLRLCYRARGFAAARVTAEEVSRGGELAVVFRIEEGRVYHMGKVRFPGVAFHDEAWLSSRLAAVLDDGGGEPEDPAADRARALLVSVPGSRPPRGPPPPLAPRDHWEEGAWDRAAERIVDTYRADGFLEAAYLGSTLTLDARRGAADVTVRLREGPRTFVESISFDGNAAVSLPELAREARLAPGGPLLAEKVEATRVGILRLYLARGHLYARVDARQDLDRERHLAAVRYVVEEGPRVRIGRIVITGNRRTREEVVRRALELSEGGVYDPDAVARTQAALLRLGVFRSVGVRLQDAEVPGESKDLAVELSERPWATLSQGVGFSIANGPRATVEYTQPNLLGRALELSARGKVNYPLDTFRPDLKGKSPSERLEGRADVGLRSAQLDLLSLPMDTRTDVIAERLHRRAYDLSRVSGILGLDVGVTSRVAFSLQYELEVDRIQKSDAVGFLTQADLERLRFDQGVTTLQSVRPTVSLDFRDNSAHPHRGWFASATAELAHSIGGPGDHLVFGLVQGSDIHTNLVKVSSTLSGYLPIGRGSVLALSLRGGRVFPLDGTSRTIIPKRFFMGGASTMRGYAEDEMIQEDVRKALAEEARQCATSLTGIGCTQRGRNIAGGQIPVSEGGEAFLLAKGELRVQLHGSLEGGFFVDMGNLWLDPERYRLLDLRANAGFGLRFVTPIGPAALDIGFNLSPDRAINERVFAPHFTIGLF